MNALKHLEQAEITIDAGYIDLARDLVYSMPERMLDICLAWLALNPNGYKYNLSRFVFESVDPPSMYTGKDGTAKDLLIYKARLTLIRQSAASANVIPPLVKTRPKKDKSKTLAMSFSQGVNAV